MARISRSARSVSGPPSAAYKTSNNYADIRFSYHTTDRYDYSLASILATNPTPSNQYWGHHVQYTSN